MATVAVRHGVETMVDDIRIDITFPQHWKTVALVQACGEGAVRCLLTLWCFAATRKADGNLAGMTDMQIELASQWSGEPGKFVGTLREVRFLEDTYLHDWKEHQPWVFHAPTRSRAARKAAKALWDKRLKIGMRPACASHAPRNADSCGAHAPLPSPLPTPTCKSGADKPAPKHKRFVPPTVEEVSEYCRERTNAIDPQRFVDHYSARNWIPKGYTQQMSDWKAAVRTWEKNQVSPQTQQPRHQGNIYSLPKDHLNAPAVDR